MNGSRKTLVFVVLSFGAGTLLWMSAVYFRRKRRQRAAITRQESTQSEEKPRERTRRSRVPGLLSRAQMKSKSLKNADNNKESGRGNQHDELANIDAYDRRSMIPDGKASDDSMPSTSNPEHLIDRFISQGVEEFEFALEHWYQATKYLLENREQSGISSQARNQQELTLRAIINSSQQLRRDIIMCGLAQKRNYALTPSSVQSWVTSGLVCEENIAQLNEKYPEEYDSDAESFVSASESAALEFDDLIEEKFLRESSQLKMFRQTIMKAAGQHSHLEFYISGLEHYARCDVECRKMRTEVVGCESDMEFLAKVVCIRQASELAFSSPDNCTWMTDTGRFMLSSVIVATGKDPTNFEAAFDELLEFCSKPENWQQIETELIGRRVPMMSFYDVPLDYVLLDAFDDLATPPYSVATAIQNRWLSASIKEAALTAAIWGVLKAKASYLENQYGFMAHFYVVSQYILPLLAWGFLGPDEELKDLCDFFKEQILGYVRDIFSFETADYSTVTSLSDSIISLARQRNEILTKRLQKALPQNGLDAPNQGTV